LFSHNLPSDRARELFGPYKEAESLLGSIYKKLGTFGFELFSALMFRLIQAFHKKTTGSHVALYENYSAPVRFTDLVEVSKDAASLLVALEKNFLLGGAVFCV